MLKNTVHNEFKENLTLQKKKSILDKIFFVTAKPTLGIGTFQTQTEFKMHKEMKFV